MKINKTGPTFPNIKCHRCKIPLFKQACQPLKYENLSIRDKYLKETINAVEEMNNSSLAHKYKIFTALLIGGGLGVLSTLFFRNYIKF